LEASDPPKSNTEIPQLPSDNAFKRSSNTFSSINRIGTRQSSGILKSGFLEELPSKIGENQPPSNKLTKNCFSKFSIFSIAQCCRKQKSPEQLEYDQRVKDAYGRLRTVLIF